MLVVACLAACADVADHEMTPEDLCAHMPWPFIDVSAVADDRGTGLTWTELPWLLEAHKEYTVYRRPVGSSSNDDAWVQVVSVTLAPELPREVVPVDLPPGRWEVGVTYTDEECGESVLCVDDDLCSSVALEPATRPDTPAQEAGTAGP